MRDDDDDDDDDSRRGVRCPQVDAGFLQQDRRKEAGFRSAGPSCHTVYQSVELACVVVRLAVCMHASSLGEASSDVWALQMLAGVQDCWRRSFTF